MSLQYVPPAIYIVLGIIYIGLAIGLKKEDCDGIFRIYGILTGILYLTLGILYIVNMQLSNNFIGIASLGVAIILLATQLWGLWLLLNNSGLTCRLTNKSQLWLWLIILQLITHPLLTGVNTFIYGK